MSNQPLLIAHRGDTVNHPENTPQAFESAFDKGADGVELDVQLANNDLIVVHDRQFDRSLDYPKLVEVLNKFVDKGRLEIELKSFSTDILEPLAKLLDKYETSNIELTTTELAMAGHIKKVFPSINIGAIFGSDHYQPWMKKETLVRKTIELMETMNAQVAHLSCLPMELVTKELVNELHKNQLKFHYHIPKISLPEQKGLYSKLIQLNVDQCTFDDIELLSSAH